MNNVKINLWNRDFELFVSYSCYPGEEITDIQKEAVVEFCNNATCVFGVLGKLKEYIEKSSDAAVKAGEIENIFKYVMPQSIFVPRTDKKVLAIMCNYKFDMEHGIAIVFEKGKFKEIEPQDSIL